MADTKADKAKEDIIETAAEAQDAPTVETEVTVTAKGPEDEATAKAGKRSTKAIKEAEEKAAKEARKAVGDTSAQGDEVAAEKKGPRPATRSRLERRGKKYRKLAEQIDAKKSYELKEALELAAKTNPAAFDASVELHVGLGVDPRQADQNVRGTVSLPHGTGKTVRVAVFAPSDQHKAAKDAGADIVGEDEFLQQLDKEQLDFDILIATPQVMAKLSKYARTLGPRGLMPNPKSGTVAADVAKAVKEAKAGRVEYRVDKQAVVHLAIGKVSFGADKLLENANVFFASLQAAKPASLKSIYIKNASATTSMGPGIKIDTSSL